MLFHYSLSFILLAFTALSSLEISTWWVKMWDAGRAQLLVFISLLLGIGIFKFDYNEDVQIALTVLLLSAMCYHLYVIFPFTPFHKKEIQNTTKSSCRLRMITCNVRMSNEDTEPLLTMLVRQNPDVILLTEVNQWWINKLFKLEEIYPHAIIHPQENTYGMALYSKYPISDSQVKFLVENEVPSIHTNINIADKTIHFIGLHPKPPTPWTNVDNKDTEIVLAASLSTNNTNPCVITGDLNDVCWSRITKTFKYLSGLKDPRVGRGLFNTYNANIPFFRYPVDHFFISDHFKVRAIRRLPHVGSDHFPILLEVNLEEE